MDDFKRQAAVGEESMTDKFWVDANGVPQPIYSKRVAVAAFPNAGAANTAHGIGASLNLSGPFNVRRVTATNGVTMLDKSKFSFTLDANNIGITDAADYHLYAGEVVIEYCKS